MGFCFPRTVAFEKRTRAGQCGDEHPRTARIRARSSNAFSDPQDSQWHTSTLPSRPTVTNDVPWGLNSIRAAGCTVWLVRRPGVCPAREPMSWSASLRRAYQSTTFASHRARGVRCRARRGWRPACTSWRRRDSRARPGGGQWVIVPGSQSSARPSVLTAGIRARCAISRTACSDGWGPQSDCDAEADRRSDRCPVVRAVGMGLWIERRQ